MVSIIFIFIFIFVINNNDLTPTQKEEEEEKKELRSNSLQTPLLPQIHTSTSCSSSSTLSAISLFSSFFYCLR